LRHYTGENPEEMELLKQVRPRSSPKRKESV